MYGNIQEAGQEQVDGSYFRMAHGSRYLFPDYTSTTVTVEHARWTAAVDIVYSLQVLVTNQWVWNEVKKYRPAVADLLWIFSRGNSFLEGRMGSKTANKSKKRPQCLR